MAVSKTSSRKKTITKSAPRVGGTALNSKHFFKGWMVALVILVVAVVGYAVVNYSDASSSVDIRALAALARTRQNWAGRELYTSNYSLYHRGTGSSRSVKWWQANNSVITWCYRWDVDDPTKSYHFKQWVRGFKQADKTVRPVSLGINRGGRVEQCVSSYTKKGSKVSAELSGGSSKTLKKVGWKLGN